MQLPPSLRAAIDRELEGIALADLARAAEALSNRYRAEIRDGRLHVDDGLAACAYLATRLPATYAAIARSLQAATQVRPDLAPCSVLDIGAGPGTATWAAAEHWPSLQSASLIEGSTAMRSVGERLGTAPGLRTEWKAARIDTALTGIAAHDLVLMAYVLDELEPTLRDQLIPRLWALTGEILIIVEPGTSEGWKRILHARDQLITAGAHILAPCPHARACPLSPPDWCHFSVRLPRSRLHREAKGGTVPWEDEKFTYLAASRLPGIRPEARVLAPPRMNKTAVTLKLCQKDGRGEERSFARRERGAFKAARKLDWGDILQK
ncbi:MAG TPA: small ribosomal subunit Rsm22 family protein [Dongiaceae bacterium]|jgi:ribosomal protein RSM22 (predicted rRNA methylase)|nr:small ribosomal subunit Rsm22 family protein [Dongiaceae bacterium]